MRAPLSREIRLCLLAVAAGVDLVWLAVLARHLAVGATNTDFVDYYDMVRVGLRYGFSHMYDLGLQAAQWSALGLHNFVPVPQTPPLALLLVPFALLPLPLAWAAWGTLCLGVLLLGWRLATSGLGRARWPLLVVGLSPVPVIMALSFGQASVLVGTVVLGSWWLIGRGREVEAGLVLALIALKPQVAFLVPLALLLAGGRRTFAAWLAGSAVLALASYAVLGPGGFRQWLALLGDASANPAAFYVPVRLTLQGLLGGGVLAAAARILVGAVAMLAAWRARGGEPGIPVVAGLVASLLTTPFLHVQDLALLVPAAWIYVRGGLVAWQWSLLAAGYLAAGVADSALLGPAPIVLFEVAWVLSLLRQPAAAAVRSSSWSPRALGRRGEATP